MSGVSYPNNTPGNPEAGSDDPEPKPHYPDDMTSLSSLSFTHTLPESTFEIGLAIEMSLPHLSRHQDTTLYPTRISAIFDVQFIHHFLSR